MVLEWPERADGDDGIDGEALKRASRQVERAARVLELRRRRLQRLLQRLGLQPESRRHRSGDDVGG
jgi:DNA-binding NtrC family response regulator